MKFKKRLALAGYMREKFGVIDIHDPASVREYFRRFKQDAVGAAYDADGVSKVCSILRQIPRVDVPDEKLLEYDRNIRGYLVRMNRQRHESDQIVFVTVHGAWYVSRT